MKLRIIGDWQTRRVWLAVDGGNPIELDPAPSQALVNHSPDGFNWGYGGSGPAQLALAILLKARGETYARMFYQEFKWRHVANWPQSDLDREILLD